MKPSEEFLKIAPLAIGKDLSMEPEVVIFDSDPLNHRLKEEGGS